MKKRFLLMAAAALLLMTQCRKEEMPAANTVKMTVTVGPGSKTDITTGGEITWSDGDKLYVGENGEYIGYLTLQSGVGFPQGTFTGDVSVGKGEEHTFHFFYLGSKEYTNLEKGVATVDVDFSNQNITADNGKLNGADAFHVGYGKVENFNVVGNTISGINVTMGSKVAIACFSFTEVAGKTAYDGALTLRGNCSSMTVNFDGSFSGVKGDVSLAGGNSTKYVMLVPQETPSSVQLEFGGNVEGATMLPNGIEANKFYGISSPIEVAVTLKKHVFGVSNDSGTTVTTVEFSPGNLYWDDGESKFKFEKNQWDFRTYNDGTKQGGSCINGVYNQNSDTPKGDWGLFGWSGSTGSASYGMSTSTNSSDYSGEFKDWGEITDLPDNAGGKTWRTLTIAEWQYLLGTDDVSSYRNNAQNLRAWVTLTDVGVSGLVILHDGSEATASELTTAAKVTEAGAVFLPAAGMRNCLGVNEVGFDGKYWSGTPYGTLGDNIAHLLSFISGNVFAGVEYRHYGYAVRLVR